MKYKPHEYQKYATEYIETHPIAAVFLDMGHGTWENKHYPDRPKPLAV